MGTLLVETTAQRSFVGSESTVYVKIGKTHVQKLAQDLQVGDRVVLYDERIERSFEEVLPLFRQNVQYRAARSLLYERNAEGVEVTRLRTLLLRDLAKKTADLEQRVLLESGLDISQEEQGKIVGTLSDYVTVQESTVRRWLSGVDPIAPRDWGNYHRLAEALEGTEAGEKLEEIYLSRGKEAGFHAAYKLVTGAHSVVMRYLAGHKGETTEEKTEAETKPAVRGKHTALIELVVDAFFADCETAYPAFQVTKVTPLTKKEKRKLGYKAPDPGLRNGIVVGKKDIKTTPMRAVFKGYLVIEKAVNACLKTYGPHLYASHSLSQHGPLNVVMYRDIFPHYVSKHLIVHHPDDVHLFFAVYNRVGFSSADIERQFDRAFTGFLEDLAEGHVDATLALPYGTVAKAIDTLNQYASALPKAFHDFWTYQRRSMGLRSQLRRSSSREEHRRLATEINKLGKKRNSRIAYVQQKYNLDTGSVRFFFEHYGSVSSDPTIVWAEELFDRDQLRQYRRQAESQGFRFFFKQEVKAILATMNLAELITVYDKRNWV